MKLRTFNLREAFNQDLEKIKKLIFGVLHEYGLNIFPNTTDADLTDIEKSYFSNGGVFYVLESDEGKIIGSIGLYNINNQECELRKMYLSSSFRGKGIGRELLEFLLKKATEMSFKKIILETNSKLEMAINLYKKFGFKKFDLNKYSSGCDQAFFLNL